MPPRASGTIVERTRSDGVTTVYSIRFPALGRKRQVTLGTSAQGWSHQRAKLELRRIMREVEEGTWQPPASTRAATPTPAEEQGFRAFASEWWARKEPGLSPRTRTDYEWRLDHLIAFFRDEPVAGLDAARVDAFVARKHAQNAQITQDAAKPRPAGAKGSPRRPLGPRSINMMLSLLGSILDEAVDHDKLATNPLRGPSARRRRVKEATPQRPFLEPDMTADLLEAASQLEQQAHDHHKIDRRPLLATMALAGLRIEEVCNAKIGHLDLAQERLRVPDAKTQAGRREIELPWSLVCELRGHLAFLATRGQPRGPRAYLFPTTKGGRRDPDRLRDRIFNTAVARADELREARGVAPMPEGLTPHALRRTATSLMLAAGRDPRWVMDQVGHEDPKLTLRIYAQVMRRRNRDDELIWELMRFSDEPEQHADRHAPRRSAPDLTTGLQSTTNTRP